MKKWFIPCLENKYHPILIRPALLSVYLVFILLFNIIFINFNLVTSRAAVDFTTLYKMHNDERKDNGLNALSINTLLINSAQAKADAMLASDCWSHYCPDGKSPWDFFDTAGYIYLYAGENLAEGFVDNVAVMNAWMNSPTHKQNILNAQFSEIGIAFAYGDFQGINDNTIIVVHFGSRYTDNLNIYIPEDDIEIDPDLVIEEPKNGDIFNDPSFEIKGTAKDLKAIDIFANGNYLGSVPSESDNFTFRSPDSFAEENEYILQAKGIDLNDENISSNIVNFQMDYTAPELNNDNLSISYSEISDEDIIVILISNVSAESIKEMSSSANFKLLGKNNWQLEIDKDALLDQEDLIIYASDKAGNTSKLEVSTSKILAMAENDTLDLNNLTALANNPRLQINITFTLFLSFLFGIDSYLLNKTGNTGRVRSRSHLNFIFFIIVLILSLLTNIDGSILTGLST